VKVTFLNDAWAGTATTDRNLYVEALSYRGANTGQAATLMSAGAASFTVSGGTAPGGPAASPDNTVIRAGTAQGITDARGNLWTITAGKVAVNGTIDPTTANVTELAYVKGKIWQQNTAARWWAKSVPADAWAPDPGTAVAPINVTVTAGSQTRVADATLAHSETQFGASINLTAPGVARIVLGSTATRMSFTSMSKVDLTAGSAAATVTADGGSHRFTAGKAALTVAGGAGADAYVYHAGNARLTITDFAAAKGDTLHIDKALQGAMRIAADGQGGTLLSFGTLGAGIDLKGLANAPTTAFRWV
jgi:hypothetical protein